MTRDQAKWKTEIIAFLDGATIQGRFSTKLDGVRSKWVDIEYPAFHTTPGWEFRIKPPVTTKAEALAQARSDNQPTAIPRYEP